MQRVMAVSRPPSTTVLDRAEPGIAGGLRVGVTR